MSSVGRCPGAAPAAARAGSRRGPGAHFFSTSAAPAGPVSRGFGRAGPLPKARGVPSREVTARVMEVTQDNFDAEVLQADKPVLAKFWANWCGPCKLIDPLVKQIEESYSGNLKVVSVEVDSNPELTEKYDVYGLPTLMLFRGGEFVEGTKHEGAISKDKISAYLESHGIPAA